ncbi:hypothetical protein BJX99DRAFT_252571 [Aspergillus californicus]
MNPPFSSPQKQSEATQTLVAPHHQVSPVQILHKQQISQTTYSCLEEWAPEILEGYEVFLVEPVPREQQYDRATISTATRAPNKRVEPQSSVAYQNYATNNVKAQVLPVASTAQVHQQQHPATSRNTLGCAPTGSIQHQSSAPYQGHAFMDSEAQVSPIEPTQRVHQQKHTPASANPPGCVPNKSFEPQSSALYQGHASNVKVQTSPVEPALRVHQQHQTANFTPLSGRVPNNSTQVQPSAPQKKQTSRTHEDHQVLPIGVTPQEQQQQHMAGAVKVTGHVPNKKRIRRKSSSRCGTLKGPPVSAVGVASQEQQLQETATTTGLANVPGHVSNRRDHAQSSSHFEEWKAKSLRGPVKTTKPVNTPATPEMKDNQAKGINEPVGTEELLAEQPGKTVSLQAKTNLVDDDCYRQQGESRVEGVSAGIDVPIQSSNITNIPVPSTLESTKKKHNERRSKQVKRVNQEVIYAAPNGIHFDQGELRNLAYGINLEGKDKVYFLPCFIDDPWKGMKPTPAVYPTCGI